jgi:arylsulfatase A-like enzyme
VIRWPAGLKDPGKCVDEFVSLADFGPTFVEIAGKTPDPALSGRSLLPFLRNDPPLDWRDEMHTQCNGVELYYTQRSVMTRDFKYVFNGFDNDELYMLCRDQDEMTNLAADPDMAPIRRDMLRRMWRFACREQDSAINSYITVGLAPLGPAEAFRND